MAEQWTITGRIVVDHTLPELQQLMGTRSGLGGITVKVSARSRVGPVWGTWAAWDSVVTGPDGHFRVSKEKGSDRRQFKVQILFDSKKLRIKEGKETSISIGGDGFPIDVDLDLTDKDWHEVYSDKDEDNERRAGLHDLGDIRIDRMLVRKHGDMWVLYNKVLGLMESFGVSYDFAGKIVVKYPASLMQPGWSSYANPATGHVYIKEDQFTTYTLLHELMHKWEYDHCGGELNMAWQLVKHGNTHQPRENTTYVPFLESFADWAAVRALQEISNGELKNYSDGRPYSHPNHPFSRNYIGATLSEQERNLANLDYTERGWYGLFNVLTFPYMDRIDPDRPFVDVNGEHDDYAFLSLFPATNDLKTGYSFKDILSVFLAHPRRSIDAVLHTREMNFRDFLNRAGRVLSGLDAEKIKKVKSMLNPRVAAAAT